MRGDSTHLIGLEGIMARATNPYRSAVLAMAALAIATTSSAQERTGLVGALLKDLDVVEQKTVGLVEAIPADKFDWRPAEGVRSIGEVVMHVSADNYLLAIPLGKPAPAETGITSDYQTAVAFEKKEVDRSTAINTLKQSFAHIRETLAATQDEKLAQEAGMFGAGTVQELWILTVTHLHEHLGQLIAYARSNGVVPPWSRGG
jgi:uncharacterized damage-inducible protein DinB